LLPPPSFRLGICSDMAAPQHLPIPPVSNLLMAIVSGTPTNISLFFSFFFLYPSGNVCQRRGECPHRSSMSTEPLAAFLIALESRPRQRRMTTSLGPSLGGSTIGSEKWNRPGTMPCKPALQTIADLVLPSPRPTECPPINESTSTPSPPWENGRGSNHAVIRHQRWPGNVQNDHLHGGAVLFE